MQFKNRDPFNRPSKPSRPGCPSHDTSSENDDIFPDDSERDRDLVARIENERLQRASSPPKRGREIMEDNWSPPSDEGSFPEPVYFPVLENSPKQENRERSGTKYDRVIYPKYGGEPIVVDVYNVLDAFQVTNPAVSHAAKKVLAAGLRQKGSQLQDLSEAIDAIQRGIELERQ